jgi:hypothetical protein
MGAMKKYNPKSLIWGGCHVALAHSTATSIAALTSQHEQPLGMAACSFEITETTTAQQIMPAGQFRSKDGQSDKVATGYWYIDDAIAKNVIADRLAKSNHYMLCLLDLTSMPLC